MGKGYIIHEYTALCNPFNAFLFPLIEILSNFHIFPYWHMINYIVITKCQQVLIIPVLWSSSPASSAARLRTLYRA